MAQGKQVELIAYDLADLDGIPDLVRRVHDEHGSIDVLLNIAGYAEPKSLLDTTPTTSSRRSRSTSSRCSS